MKTILLSVLICFCAHFCNAQILVALLFGDKLNSEKVEFGLNLSPTMSAVSGMNGDYKPGLGLGLYFNLKVNAHLYFHPEINPKSALGIRNLTSYATGYSDVDKIYLNNEHANVLRKIKAISFPLLMRYRLKGLLFIEGGSQFNVFLRSEDVFAAAIDGNEITYTTKINDQVSFMDAGLAGGLAYKFKKDKGVGIGIRYYYGVTDVMKKINGAQRNSAFYLSASLPIVPRSR